MQQTTERVSVIRPFTPSVIYGYGLRSILMFL